MRVVLDTNIFISALIFPGGLPEKIIILAKNNKIKIFCSDFIIKEFKNILVIKFDYSEQIAQKFIDEILKFVTIIHPKKKINLIKEKNSDNRILECAVEARADFLISGDNKHILSLEEYRKVKIISARRFLDEIMPNIKEPDF